MVADVLAPYNDRDFHNHSTGCVLLTYNTEVSAAAISCLPAIISVNNHACNKPNLKIMDHTESSLPASQAVACVNIIIFFYCHQTLLYFDYHDIFPHQKGRYDHIHTLMTARSVFNKIICYQYRYFHHWYVANMLSLKWLSSFWLSHSGKDKIQEIYYGIYSSQHYSCEIMSLPKEPTGCWLPTSFEHNCFTHLPLDKMAAILAENIFKLIFYNVKDRILIQISLKFDSRSPIDNEPALVQVMA